MGLRFSMVGATLKWASVSAKFTVRLVVLDGLMVPLADPAAIGFSSAAASGKTVAITVTGPGGSSAYWIVTWPGRVLAVVTGAVTRRIGATWAPVVVFVSVT